MSRYDYTRVDLRPALNVDGFVLFHAGKSNSHGEIYVPTHTHSNFYEITVATQGNGQIFVGDELTEIKKGDVFVSFPFENHRIEADSVNHISYASISFDVQNPAYSEKLKKVWFYNTPPKDRLINCPYAAELIKTLLLEFEGEEGKYSHRILSSVMEQLTIYVLRGFSDRISEPISKAPTEIELARQTAHFVDTHLITMKNLKECAGELNYNYCYLSTVFKHVFGITLSEYHRIKRLDMSKALMDDTEHTLSEISEMLGYSTPAAFCKSFKQKFGISPSAYKKSPRT